jgi:L-alanine-DL-glutamate epimerase-like enolase superfamily enzyme
VATSPTDPEAVTRELPEISSIEVREVCVPREAHNRITTTYGTLPDAHFALVLVTADGVTGIGEAATERWWTGEDAATVRHAVERFFAPALIGKRIGIRQASRVMNGAAVGHPYAKAAIEIALWDLLGRTVGQPLYVLLGGGDAAPIPIKYVIGMGPPDHLRSELSFGRELGFSFFKTKVGTVLAEDLERVSVLTDLLEEGESLGVDAQAGWSPVTALASLRPLADLGVSFLEQPVSPELPEAMAALTARGEIPIVAHESIFSVRSGLDAVSRGIAHIWALTPSTHGGIAPTLDLLSLARVAGIGCLLGSNIELGVSTAMMTQLAAAFDDFRECSVPSDIIGPLYHGDDIVVRRPEIVAGHIRVPAGAGLGVELDWDRVKHYQVS